VTVADRLLTAREVAERLGFKHPETVLRWVRRGEGPPAMKLHNGAIRFDKEAVENYKRERRATTARGVVTHPAGRRPVGNLTPVTHPHHEEDS
jgi:predicted DNA-binding transcriptional regulator AlpA